MKIIHKKTGLFVCILEVIIGQKIQKQVYPSLISGFYLMSIWNILHHLIITLSKPVHGIESELNDGTIKQHGD